MTTFSIAAAYVTAIARAAAIAYDNEIENTISAASAVACAYADAYANER